MDEVPDSAQHYIECETKFCRKFSKFYCNICHQRICELCRDAHLKENTGHEIVLYQKRNKRVPLEKCRKHPSKNIDIYCNVCQEPVCAICFVDEHNDHANINIETIYNDILQQCHEEITHIRKTVIPEAKNNIESIKEKRENAIKKCSKLRVFMKNRADELKEAVDNILTNNNKKLDEMENSFLSTMDKQRKETEDYINYLIKMASDCESKMLSLIKPTELIKLHLDISLTTLKMPYKAKPKLPTFLQRTLNKEEIVKMFGEIDSTERFKLSSVIKVHEIPIQGRRTYHLSPLPSNKFWASDSLGNLIQYDMKGKILGKKMSTGMWNIRGNHTVTTEGVLLYTDNSKNAIYRVTNYKTIEKLIETGNWKPGAIYSSPINGHILVGLGTHSDNKVTRYKTDGRKLQDIRLDNKGQTLYQSVHFITENINGDICTSDFIAKKVVVVTKLGEYRFSYNGHHSQIEFHPYGICANSLGHILVCNSNIIDHKNYSSVHLLDINGHFLCFLLTPEQCPPFPCALCIDHQHNLWVGRWNSFTVSVYKYLQVIENDIV